MFRLPSVRGCSAIVLSAVVLSSCATTPHLAGNPDDTGLVVVEAVFDVRNHGLTRAMAFGRKGYTEPAAMGRIRKKQRTVTGRSFRRRLLFTGLEPGKYRLVDLGYLLGNGSVTAPLPQDADEGGIRFEVKPGEVTYLGKLILRVDSGGSMKLTAIEVDTDTQHEINTWKAMLANKRYAEGPWGELIKERLMMLTTAYQMETDASPAVQQEEDE